MSDPTTPPGDHRAIEPDPAIDAYRRHVDTTLLLQNLRHSPTARLRNLQALQRFAEELRRAGEAQRRP